MREKKVSKISKMLLIAVVAGLLAVAVFALPSVAQKSTYESEKTITPESNMMGKWDFMPILYPDSIAK